MRPDQQRPSTTIRAREAISLSDQSMLNAFIARFGNLQIPFDGNDQDLKNALTSKRGVVVEGNEILNNSEQAFRLMREGIAFKDIVSLSKREIDGFTVRNLLQNPESENSRKWLHYNSPEYKAYKVQRTFKQAIRSKSQESPASVLNPDSVSQIGGFIKGSRT